MRFNEDEDKRVIEEEEILKQHLLSKAQISIMLKSYDDIFSSFDPRPYPQRALSDDFLIEAKKAAIDKEGNPELSFLIPKNTRNLNDEVIIKKRLRDHFKRHANLIEKEIHDIKRSGIRMAMIGAILIVIASVLSFFEEQYKWLHFLIILLEPAGWFTGWTGLDEIHYSVREKKPDFNFYNKMSNAEITFHTY